VDAPLDPFAGDPDDPARALDDDLLDDTVRTPMAPDEREEVLSDLEDVEVFEALLAPRGVKGVVAHCADCDDAHYLSWDLLRANLRQLLDAGTTPVHEPASSPDPSDYVTWDYARGFMDASLES
jgi:hypothetical protein